MESDDVFFLLYCRANEISSLTDTESESFSQPCSKFFLCLIKKILIQNEFLKLTVSHVISLSLKEAQQVVVRQCARR